MGCERMRELRQWCKEKGACGHGPCSVVFCDFRIVIAMQSHGSSENPDEVRLRLNRENCRRVRFRFEKFPVPRIGPIEEFAQTVEGIVREAPWLVSQMPFGHTAGVCAGLLEALPAQLAASPLPEGLRLKAIETPVGNVEHTYDRDGRLERTVYPDNEWVCYRWDDETRVVEVLPHGRSTVRLKFTEGGLLEKAVYQGNRHFAWRYGRAGQLLGCEYPDGVSVQYRYDPRRRLVETGIGPSRFHYTWGPDSQLAVIAFEHEGRRHQLEFTGGALECRFHASGASPGDRGQVRFASALGLWGLDEQGRINEMILPTGERWCRTTTTKEETIWSPAGQHICRCSENGAVREIVRSDGCRCLYLRVPNTLIAVMVEPETVALYQYDKKGYLQKVLRPDGSYVLYAWDKRGRCLRMEDLAEVRRRSFSDGGKLAGVRFGAGCEAGVEWAGGSTPRKMSLRGFKRWELEPLANCVLNLWDQHDSGCATASLRRL